MSVQALRKKTGPMPGARPSSAGGPPPNAWTGVDTGVEGREDELGKSIAVVLKTLKNTKPYAHEINDALIKARLHAMQFAKDHGLMEEYVAHDIKSMKPLNDRMKALVQKTGQSEIALIGIFDRTACHYQLCLETESSPRMRRWRSPFARVLAASHRIGQFDLTEDWIHEHWTRPRLLGYAEHIGVEMRVSHWQPDGWLTAEVV